MWLPYHHHLYAAAICSLLCWDVCVLFPRIPLPCASKRATPHLLYGVTLPLLHWRFRHLLHPRLCFLVSPKGMLLIFLILYSLLLHGHLHGLASSDTGRSCCFFGATSHSSFNSHRAAGWRTVVRLRALRHHPSEVSCKLSFRLLRHAATFGLPGDV